MHIKFLHYLIRHFISFPVRFVSQPQSMQWNCRNGQDGDPGFFSRNSSNLPPLLAI